MSFPWNDDSAPAAKPKRRGGGKQENADSYNIITGTAGAPKMAQPKAAAWDPSDYAFKKASGRASGAAPGQAEGNLMGDGTATDRFARGNKCGDFSAQDAAVMYKSNRARATNNGTHESAGACIFGQ
jgi:hypothetical protein